MEEFENLIVEKLMSTERDGMKDLIAAMKNDGFFAAPCSGSNHLAKEGGLAEHSWNVLGIMQDMSFLLAEGSEVLPDETHNAIIICALLHDLGKMGDYGKPNYVPNMIKSRKKDENGEYPLVQSEAKPYEINKELLYIPQEGRSWHNGLYGSFKYDISGKETPLYLLLHFSDMWASRIVEEK